MRGKAVLLRQILTARWVLRRPGPDSDTTLRYMPKNLMLLCPTDQPGPDTCRCSSQTPSMIVAGLSSRNLPGSQPVDVRPKQTSTCPLPFPMVGRFANVSFCRVSWDRHKTSHCTSRSGRWCTQRSEVGYLKFVERNACIQLMQDGASCCVFATTKRLGMNENASEPDHTIGCSDQSGGNWADHLVNIQGGSSSSDSSRIGHD